MSQKKTVGTKESGHSEIFFFAGLAFIIAAFFFFLWYLRAPWHDKELQITLFGSFLAAGFLCVETGTTQIHVIDSEERVKNHISKQQKDLLMQLDRLSKTLLDKK